MSQALFSHRPLYTWLAVQLLLRGTGGHGPLELRACPGGKVGLGDLRRGEHLGPGIPAMDYVANCKSRSGR
jgi:hypothetical protein